jgi:mRNA-degrading endonuclease YafQ of YafQ-DinJ toxin-antitoxin module
MAYQFASTKEFDKKFSKLTKKNIELKKRVLDTLKLLIRDPFYPSLKSHKAMTKNNGRKWSSSVSGDIRLIWDFGENGWIILHDVGSHSGKTRVYR